MNQMELPKTRQPEAVPQQPIPPPPSLLTYGVLLSFAVALMLVPLRWGDATWSDLSINFASGIFGAAIVLIFVERRLRVSELQQVRRLPKQLRFMVNLGLFPTFRQVYRYGRAFDVQLRQALGHAVEPANVHQLFPKVYNGFVLVARGGIGKTTSLQFAAAKVMQEFLNLPNKKKVPLLFPLHRWRSDHRTLEQALFAHVNSYVKVSHRAFRVAMKHGTFVAILDGADEVSDETGRNFESQFPALRKKYPRVAWSISSRSSPVCISDLPIVTLSPPTQDEMRKIGKRLKELAREDVHSDNQVLT